mmetsp:Transcript_25677/g.43257  ORF Transcript_25677/g.43257 Transcript_25677/m.43257 type:complete len:320 (-) Transcript_25677:330-1289(-)
MIFTRLHHLRRQACSQLRAATHKGCRSSDGRARAARHQHQRSVEGGRIEHRRHTLCHGLLVRGEAEPAHDGGVQRHQVHVEGPPQQVAVGKRAGHHPGHNGISGLRHHRVESTATGMLGHGCDGHPLGGSVLICQQHTHVSGHILRGAERAHWTQARPSRGAGAARGEGGVCGSGRLRAGGHKVAARDLQRAAGLAAQVVNLVESRQATARGPALAGRVRHRQDGRKHQIPIRIQRQHRLACLQLPERKLGPVRALHGGGAGEAHGLGVPLLLRLLVEARAGVGHGDGAISGAPLGKHRRYHPVIDSRAGGGIGESRGV